MGELAGTLERLQERLIIIGGLQRSAEERATKQAESGAPADDGHLVRMLEEEKERLGGRVEQLGPAQLPNHGDGGAAKYGSENNRGLAPSSDGDAA
jgi:hypothetical protein